MRRNELRAEPSIQEEEEVVQGPSSSCMLDLSAEQCDLT